MHNESSNATITFVFNHADSNGHVGFACRFARFLLTCGDAPVYIDIYIYMYVIIYTHMYIYIYVCMHNENSNATMTSVFNHADNNSHVGFACRFARCLLTCGDAPLWPCGFRLWNCSRELPFGLRLPIFKLHVDLWRRAFMDMWASLVVDLQ